MFLCVQFIPVWLIKFAKYLKFRKQQLFFCKMSAINDDAILTASLHHRLNRLLLLWLLDNSLDILISFRFIDQFENFHQLICNLSYSCCWFKFKRPSWLEITIWPKSFPPEFNYETLAEYSFFEPFHCCSCHDISYTMLFVITISERFHHATENCQNSGISHFLKECPYIITYYLSYTLLSIIFCFDHCNWSKNKIQCKWKYLISFYISIVGLSFLAIFEENHIRCR